MLGLLIAGCYCGYVIGQDYGNFNTSYTNFDNLTDNNASYYNFLIDLENDPYYQIMLLNLDQPEVWHGGNWLINASSVYEDYTTKNLFDADDTTFWLSQYGSEVTTTFIELGV